MQLTTELPDPRILDIRRRRAEVQAICALLHAASFLGFFALVASGIVWATQRSRSRFLAVQSFQAILFQAIILIGAIVTFGLFTIGFNIALLTGLIARSGVNEPGLTTSLISGAALGFGATLLFQVLLPLCGFWAAIRVWRGHAFLYPILGRIAVNWHKHRYNTREGSPSITRTLAERTEGENVLAGVTHLSVLLGIGPMLAPILWATHRQRSPFLTYHLVEAALFQLAMLGLSTIWFVSSDVLMSRLFPSSSGLNSVLWIGISVSLPIATGVLCVSAAIRAFRGKMARYPIIGKWVARYLGVTTAGAA